jgi:hypothetical protein
LKIEASHVSKRIAAGTNKEDALDIFTAIAEATGRTTAIDTGSEINSTIDKTTVAAHDKVTFGTDEVSVTNILAAAKKQAGVK